MDKPQAFHGESTSRCSLRVMQLLWSPLSNIAYMSGCRIRTWRAVWRPWDLRRQSRCPPSWRPPRPTSPPRHSATPPPAPSTRWASHLKPRSCEASLGFNCNCWAHSFHDSSIWNCLKLVFTISFSSGDIILPQCSDRISSRAVARPSLHHFPLTPDPEYLSR